MLLGAHPCYRANHTFCCLNTDWRAKHRHFHLGLTDLRLEQVSEVLATIVQVMHDVDFYVYEYE